MHLGIAEMKKQEKMVCYSSYIINMNVKALNK